MTVFLRMRPSFRRVATILAVILPPLGAGFGPDGVEEQLQEILRKEGQVEVLAAELATLGPGAAKAMLGLLARGTFENGPPLAESQEQVLLQGLAGLDRRHVYGAAREVASEGERGFEGAMRALSVLVPVKELHVLLETAVPSGKKRVTYARALAFEEALGNWLLTHEEGLEELRRLWRRIDERLVPFVVKATRRCGLPARIHLYAELLSWGEQGVEALLPEIRRVGNRLPWYQRQPLARRIRGRLDREDLRSAAMLALGSLGDTASVPALIDAWIEHGEIVAPDARTSLCEITGLSMHRSLSDWETWYEKELTWLNEAAPQEIEGLRSEHRHEATAALMALSRHPQLQHELTGPILDMLVHQDGELRKLACQVLAEFRATEAVPELVLLLEADDEGVRQAACAALRSITGHELGPDPERWDELVSEADDFLSF